MHLEFEDEVWLIDMDFITNLINYSFIIVISITAAVGLTLFFSMCPMWNAIVDLEINNANLLLKIKKQQLSDQIICCGNFLRFVNSSEGADNFGYTKDMSQSINEEDENENENEKEDEKFLRKVHKTKRNAKAHIEYKPSAKLLIISMLCVYIFDECYSLSLFFVAKYVNNRLYNHLEEMIMLKRISKDHSRFYGLMIDSFRSASVMDLSILSILASGNEIIDNSINDQENVIRHFVENKHYFSDEYNDKFLLIMQDTICQPFLVKNVSECEIINDAILVHGLYAINIKFLLRYKDKINGFLSIDPSMFSYDVFRSKGIIQNRKLVSEQIRVLHLCHFLLSVG